MAVDVVTSIEIDVDRDQVAAFASNPENAPRWYVNISSVVLETAPPLAVGSRMAFVAHFLRRRIAYTYEVRELRDGERFVMSTADGPFPMQTTYTWSDTADGGTRMTLRNQGEPSGFGHLTAPVIARAMRRANRKDLQRLKSLLENSTT
ncbi:SRPBCC family protein [Terrabacter terrae]|uniref:SRPBCC family protein n=1 Tax=Terrabacter terrae TaxID=318434 RepID=A0ABN2U9A6_9MICO